MTESTPYLSLVVAARNDDHGGNLLGRMQAFFKGWVAQCKKHGLSSELIIVEWNPPGDRPSLAEALRCPADPAPCSVRFIQVPPEIHQGYRYADVLPLYQMIAKNVGIRRARGKFVLATNVDILFCDELVQYFAEGRLRPGRMYRIDRFDVMSDVPGDDSVEEQLGYCRSHLIRVNVREGTYRLTADGLRALESRDIAPPDSGISFGRGWFAVEHPSEHEVFRWVENDAEVLVRISQSPPPSLYFEIEPGPGVGNQAFQLQVLDEDGSAQAHAVIEGPSRLTLRLPSDGQAVRRFSLRVIGGGLPTPQDPRIMNFRVFHCGWSAASEPAPDGSYKLEASAPTFSVHQASESFAMTLAEAYRFYREAGGIARAAVAAARCYVRSQKLPVKLGRGDDIFERGSGIRPGAQWYSLERHLGETFRWVSKEAQVIIRCPKELQPKTLVLVVEPGPGVRYQSFELLVRDEDGRTAARALVKGLELLEIPLSIEPGKKQVFRLTLEGGGLPAPRDPRILNFRVLWCGWSKSATAADHVYDQARQRLRTNSESLDEFGEAQQTNHSAPVFLHTNGCGDFTLMAREHWFDLRGYPEFDLFSMNLDSILCYAAHHAGFREEILPDPMRIYHIEHQTGSGWTPEGQSQLFARLAAKGLPFIDYAEVVAWASQMRRLNRPMIFNGENWGLADCELRETSPDCGISARGGT
jgi:hypothetical protein